MCIGFLFLRRERSVYYTNKGDQMETKTREEIKKESSDGGEEYQKNQEITTIVEVLGGPGRLRHFFFNREEE
jgi:hypothetical protein